jgi:hypothetical protein
LWCSRLRRFLFLPGAKSDKALAALRRSNNNLFEQIARRTSCQRGTIQQNRLVPIMSIHEIIAKEWRKAKAGNRTDVGFPRIGEYFFPKQRDVSGERRAAAVSVPRCRSSGSLALQPIDQLGPFVSGPFARCSWKPFP